MSDSSAPEATEAARRLDRLEDYLRADPANGHLLADSFEAALALGAWERAEFHLRHAQALGLQPPAWALREAHWLLAQHRWPEARVALRGLGAQVLPGSPEDATIVHDLAYIDWQTGEVAAGVARFGALARGWACGWGRRCAAAGPLAAAAATVPASWSGRWPGLPSVKPGNASTLPRPASEA